MNQIDFNFTLEAKDPQTAARAGFFDTAHGRTLTPAFMPVATHAILRGIETPKFQELGYKTILANTYHLLLRPGQKVFEHFSGIHGFMGWPNSVLTDSGGFQIFCMSDQLKISEEGAIFRSYTDGKYIKLSPELSIQMQGAINSDIMMVLDQCIPSLSDRQQTLDALNLTYRWAQRSFNARKDSRQALFGIVQGACFPDLRKLSAEQIASINFDGFAIGGVAVGEEKNKRDDIIAYTASLLPSDKPRYVMGIGTPLDLLEAVNSGVDMFDCILPAALGQQGVCFTSKGKIDLRKGLFKFKEEPLDPECGCSTCRTYSTAYLHHLVKCTEYVGGSLIAYHNLYFYKSLVDRMRASILQGTFSEFYKHSINELNSLSRENPPKKPAARKIEEDLLNLGDYQVIENKGCHSILQKSSGEVMHSVLNPDEEANKLYVEQSRLLQRLKETADPEKTFVIWDVGLGAAHNAMATLKACIEFLKDSDTAVKIELISFENDLDSLKLALCNKNHFRHLLHEAPRQLIKKQIWQNENFSWRLVEGDFCQTFSQHPAADIIFFDPFSYKTNSSFWTHSLLKQIFEHSSFDTELFTYSASTAFRAALLLAGFYVAKGYGTGPKSETTAAIKLRFKSENNGLTLLDQSWLERWERSDNKLPADLNGQDLSLLRAQLRNHPQFA